MAHARRYFIEALDSDKNRAEYALTRSINSTLLKRIAHNNSWWKQNVHE